LLGEKPEPPEAVQDLSALDPGRWYRWLGWAAAVGIAAAGPGV